MWFCCVKLLLQLWVLFCFGFLPISSSLSFIFRFHLCSNLLNFFRPFVSVSFLSCSSIFSITVLFLWYFLFSCSVLFFFINFNLILLEIRSVPEVVHVTNQILRTTYTVGLSFFLLYSSPIWMMLAFRFKSNS